MSAAFIASGNRVGIPASQLRGFTQILEEPCPFRVPSIALPQDCRCEPSCCVRQCWRSVSGLCACWVSTLSTDLHPSVMTEVLEAVVVSAASSFLFFFFPLSLFFKC